MTTAEKHLNYIKLVAGSPNYGIVKIFQDDASGEWFIKNDWKILGHGRTFGDAVEMAMKDFPYAS